MVETRDVSIDTSVWKLIVFNTGEELKDGSQWKLPKKLQQTEQLQQAELQQGV